MREHQAEMKPLRMDENVIRNGTNRVAIEGSVEWTIALHMLMQNRPFHKREPKLNSGTS